ncbi:poly [ADP-ribose] polymerase isoform X2 [Bactrocera neohumeralis]|uniref:poly [ADP-ribose] polymerase isoform X2 n=1 Tax=Bactrocera tryoni TaxID=59916 RepID=UPI001A95C1B8|nr:poly [ADP-ribose] polymerase isoform X2 [Bactrocera tryoni]XP_050338072.1 poly [ADP-ribose] polymerase isoform X2 [Bactrocera neohumeralis]
MDLALPYKSEYAKSGRASCKMCKCSIAQGSLRLAAMVQSAFHDGKQPMWFHEDCFFKKQRPQSVGDIENFENIRFEDQERIKLKIEKSSEVSAGSSAKKGKKRGTAEVNALKDFGIEYAKTSRATCRGCEQKILKDQVRIKKTVYDTEVGMKYGGQPLWHHVECFVQLRSELGWFGSGDCVPGFKGLKRDDQTTILKLLPAIDAGSACNIKKVKIEPDVKIEEEIMNKQIENQSKRLFKLRDLVVNQMHKKDIIYLLEYNNQKPANGDSERMLNQLADMLTFGSLLPCPQCKSCEILFSKSGYLCNGQLTEWTKCSNILKNPERKPCKVPKSLKEKYAFLSEIKNKTEHRIVKYNPPSIAVVSKNKNGKTENEPTKYWVFRSWGRIGTTIGDQKLENFENLYEAKQSFLLVYHDKTGNDFTNREHFIKVPGRMYPIEIDYEEQKTIYPENFKIKSKLNTSVQSLIKILFDVDTMKRTMMMFDLDMEKMPLGKLSEKQIQSAYKVLSEIYDLIQQNGMTVQFIDATNRFYTLIPHNFGVQNPPILDNIELVEKHRQVLDSLLEIECAYGMLQAENKEENVNPLDKHYDQLKTKLDPIDKNSEEYKILEKYVRNTHAETHKMYKLEIVEIFKVVRQGENRRYKPFKKLENRKLLWHGSRLTNFAGILSHGLKIAPPEAPVTGYMFGKGIYFADMVSKSANYCCTTAQDSTGLMILSEVALGNMLECTSSKYITKLPSNKHSTLGRGQTMPDPKDSYKREDGVEIPLGKPITDTSLKTSLLYNEYIVYDVAQVNIQYLFRMNFKYNI